MAKNLKSVKDKKLPKVIESKIDLGSDKAKGFWGDFKKFAVKGNVLDLATGVVIGTAFTTIVNSLVNNVIMPTIGLVTGNVDFSNYYLNLTGTNYNSLKEAQDAGAAVIQYGLLLNAIINFLIISLVIFFIVKYVIRRNEKEEKEKKIETKRCPYCFEEVKLEATKCKWCSSKI